MAKVIEFYVRDLFPKKAKSVPREERGEVISFPSTSQPYRVTLRSFPNATEATLALRLSLDVSN
jgi:hypothetical protein